MFSSNNGISPFPQVLPYMNWYPSTSSPFPPSSNCLNENQSSTVSQHEDLLAYCLSTHAPETTNNAPKTSIPRSRPRRQKSVKKERHSKIFTAKGPRDRRVRLSIDISKKFFGLQDLLGFDKASLTLDWLLTSSKAAIEELLRIKKIDSYDNAMCQLCSSSEAESRKRKRKSGAFFIDKVAEDQLRRARARERARERTRVKTCLRNLLICSQQHKLPDLLFPFGFDSPANPTSGEHSLPPPLPAEPGFMVANLGTGEVNAHEKVKIRPPFYPHML